MKNTQSEQLHHPSNGINLQPDNARELAAWLGENDHQSDHPLLYREIISEELKLAMMDLAMDRELMPYRDPAEINVNLGLIRFFNRFGCKCIDTGIVHSRGTKVGNLELPDGSFVEISLTPEIDLSETAAAQSSRAGQLGVAQRRHASHDERIKAIAESCVEFEILHPILLCAVEKFPITPMGLPPDLKLLMAASLNSVTKNLNHI